MNIRPMLTYRGNCEEAIDLYKRAFNTETIELMRFSDMPPNPDFPITDDIKNRILQATLKMGDNFIRMMDCGPNYSLNDSETEKISIVVETSVDETKHAFDVLSEKGKVSMPLEKTFYSPCAGVVFDKFGVMWHFAAEQ